jgi:2-keto-3-deoxy-6-phosphogluconate aldolase
MEETEVNQSFLICEKLQNDIKNYKNAGASAFGIGSPMFPSSLIKTLNEMDILNYFKSFKEKWEQC